MAGKFSLPKELSFSGNLSENWSSWKKKFGFYITATESNSKPDAVKTSRLLTALGEKEERCTIVSLLQMMMKL